MARFLQASRRSLLPLSRTLASQNNYWLPAYIVPDFLSQAQAQMSTVISQKSPFESNIIRLLQKGIDYQSEYAPPHQPATDFSAFKVEDRPGEQWVTLRGKFGDNESIKIEATMFDGSAIVPSSSNDGPAEDVQLHISLLVDISKGDGGDLEFVCSAWPDRIEIQKVYIFGRDRSLSYPYLGPDFRDLDKKLQSAFLDFLKEREVNDDLAVFLHQFMTNKSRYERLQWLSKVKSIVEQ